MTERPTLAHLVSIPTRGLGSEVHVADVEGVGWSGTDLRLPLTSTPHRWLLLFLGSHCDGCQPFWLAAGEPAAFGLGPRDRVVTVMRPAPHEDGGALEALAADETVRATLVLSESAWQSYRVQGPPFFVLVDAGRVATEGVAWSVEYVAAEVGRARAGSPRGAGA